MTVRDSLSFAMAPNRFDESGRPHDAEDSAAAAKSMLGQLEWWGAALRRARAEAPYGG